MLSPCYHHILDAKWLFGGVKRSQVEFHTGGSRSQNRPRLLEFSLYFMVLADGKDSHT